MPNLKPIEWLIIIAVIVLLFGAKRLPDAARGLGRSLRIFKAETKGLTEDGAAAELPATETTASPTTPAAPAAAAQPPTAPPVQPAAAEQPAPSERAEG